MMDQRIRARRWARALGASSPVNAALAGVFHSISNGTYDCSLADHACPVTDMSLGGKAFGKPRLPFIITPVVDGTASVGDEFAYANSLCRSHTQYDFPEEGENTATQSSLRVPNPQFDCNLGILPGSVPEGRRIIVEAMPSCSRFKSVSATDAAKHSRKSGLPQHLCKHTQYHLRQRQIRTEEAAKEAALKRSHVASATAELPEVHSEQLSPEQTDELQTLIETYKDQISWDPNDIGCLSDEYREFYLTIPTV